MQGATAVAAWLQSALSCLRPGVIAPPEAAALCNSWRHLLHEALNAGTVTAPPSLTPAALGHALGQQPLGLSFGLGLGQPTASPALGQQPLGQSFGQALGLGFGQPPASAAFSQQPGVSRSASHRALAGQPFSVSRRSICGFLSEFQGSRRRGCSRTQSTSACGWAALEPRSRARPLCRNKHAPRTDAVLQQNAPRTSRMRSAPRVCCAREGTASGPRQRGSPLGAGLNTTLPCMRCFNHGSLTAPSICVQASCP
jgi:hypothetical protein